MYTLYWYQTMTIILCKTKCRGYLNTSVCIHPNMSKIMRCFQCTRGYSRGKKRYHTSLLSCYIRKGEGGKEWVKIGWYCPDCKRLYKLNDKKIQPKKGDINNEKKKRNRMV